MSKQDKFGKKKSGVKFDRNKVYASSEVDILLADQAQQEYKEIRGKERHSRRVQAGLEEDVKPPELEKEKEEVNLNIQEPLNKHDIKRYGTSEEAEKYLYHWIQKYYFFKKNWITNFQVVSLYKLKPPIKFNFTTYEQTNEQITNEYNEYY